MSESQENNFVSIILCHYSKADDFGEKKAVKARPRSEMMREVMQSLIENTDYPAEIIVVDNGVDLYDSSYFLQLAQDGKINTYIRNKNNMYFGWAWNQGAKLATGKYLHFTCNDVSFKKNWLSTTIKPLLDNPDEKYIATPIITPDKDFEKYNRGTISGGYRLNTLAGSASMIMRRETYEELGEFSTHRIAGTHWHTNMHKKGYMVVAPPENMAEHLAHQGGVNFNEPIEVKKELLTGEVIDYSTT